MKQLFFIFFGIMLCGGSLLAQDTQPTKTKKDKKVKVRNNKDKGVNNQMSEQTNASFNSISRDRVLMELNYTGWYNPPTTIGTTTVTDVDGNVNTIEATFPINLKWFSRGANLYFMWDIPLGDKKTANFAFAPGLGISNHNVFSDARPFLDTNSESETFGETNFFRIEGVGYRFSKLATTYIEAPLEFRFRSKPDQYSQSWKVAVGLRLGYLIQSNAKYKGSIIDSQSGASFETKIKNLSKEGYNRYRLGPSFRIGYGYVSVVGFMSLTPLFEANKGPDTQAFSIGITFNSF